ncbi:MAG: DUF2461 domain-containing protein [Rhizobiaceae bacterium]
MGFDGFPKQTATYLKSLKKNNSKDWFEANRADYQAYVVEPALAFIEAMLPVAESLDPPHKGAAKLNGSFRRLNRDVRFSKDKTPYNPRIHMIFWTGDHPNRSAGIHLVLGPAGFGYGSGHWAFEGDALERYRSAVLDAGKRKSLEAALKSVGAIGCDVDEPPLKTIPRGYDKEAPGANWLRYKGIVARTMSEEAGHDPRLFTGDCTGYCAGLMQAMAPLNKWVREKVELE